MTRGLRGLTDGESELAPADDDPPTLLTSTAGSTPAVQRSSSAESGRIGRYAVLEEIGRGGMGTVVRAYDPKLRREVALKRLAPHALGPEGEARLVREAQAMAKLSHPNVVAIYDVEVGVEGVTIVMEYVAGQTLRTWLREREREWPEIVATFRLAGEGLAAAHRAGLIHRDFKPGNVLVTPEGRVEVTDFGLAKLMAPAADNRRDSADDHLDPFHSHEGLLVGDDAATLTRADVVMGTPPFMAPEQHLGRDPDARADQYAFCVSLWMGLVGEPPFTGGLLPLREAKRLGPPPWPKGSSVPRSIVAAIERGLAVDPDARWPTMDDLLVALDPARGGRRMLRAWLVGGGGVALVVGASVFAMRSSVPCSGARDQLRGIWDDDRRAAIGEGLVGTALPHAPATAERVAAHLDAYAATWIRDHTEACEATAIRHEQSAALLDRRMTCLQHAKLRLVATVDVLAKPDRAVVDRAVALVRGLPSTTQCADVASLEAETPLPSDPEVAAAVEEQRAVLARGRALLVVGRYPEAVELADAIEAAAIALDFGPLLAEAKSFRGSALTRVGRYDEAHTAHDEALQLALAHRPSMAVDVATDLVFVSADRLGRPDEAHAWASVAVGLAHARDPGGELDGAANAALGIALQAEGRYEEARVSYEQALAIRERALGENHPTVALTLSNLAITLKALGRYRDAEAAARRATELIAVIHGPQHPAVASAMDTLAGTLLDQRKMEDAERVLRSAIELRKGSLAPDHPLVAATLDNLAGLLAQTGRLEEAEVAANEAFSIAQRRLDPENAEMALFHSNLGLILRDRGRPSDALTHLRRALEIHERALAPGHPNTVVSLLNLGDLLWRLDRRDEAIELFERAWSFAATAEVVPAIAGRCGITLANALWSRPAARGRAIEVAQKARERVNAAAADRDEASLAKLDTWLREHTTNR